MENYQISHALKFTFSLKVWKMLRHRNSGSDENLYQYKNTIID